MGEALSVPKGGIGAFKLFLKMPNCCYNDTVYNHLENHHAKAFK